MDYVQAVTLLQSNIDSERRHEILLHLEQIFSQWNEENYSTLDEQSFDLLIAELEKYLKSSQMAIYTASLSLIVHLISVQSEYFPSKLDQTLSHCVPILIDRLGDSKSRARVLASQALQDVWHKVAKSRSTSIIDKNIREHGFGHKTSKVREQICLLLVGLFRDYAEFPLRPWMPHLVDLLEDPDGAVREVSKDAILSMFITAPSHAKYDLKRQLEKSKIRQTIAESIMEKVNSYQIEADAISDRAADSDIANVAVLNSGGDDGADSIASNISPIYVNTSKELETEFSKMVSDLKGKETEHNWSIREKHVHHLRALVIGNAYSSFPDTFLQGLKAVMEGFTGLLHSLRTTLSVATTRLFIDLATNLGTALDPFQEHILSNLLKLTSLTKKIVAQAGANAAITLLRSTSYHFKSIQQLWVAMGDKSQQTRLYAMQFIRVVLATHGQQDAGQIERSGGLELLEKCVKKGLGDANPKVREVTREVFWMIWEVWRDQGEQMLKGLDMSSNKLVMKSKPKDGMSAFGTQAPIGDKTQQSSSGGKLSSIPKRLATASINSPKQQQENSVALTPPMSGNSSPGLSRSRSPTPQEHSPHASPRKVAPYSPRRISSPSTLRPRQQSIISKIQNPNTLIRSEGIQQLAKIIENLQIVEKPMDLRNAILSIGQLQDVDLVGLASSLVELMADGDKLAVVEPLFSPPILRFLVEFASFQQLIPRLLTIATEDGNTAEDAAISALAKSGLIFVRDEFEQSEERRACACEELLNTLLTVGGLGGMPPRGRLDTSMVDRNKKEQVLTSAQRRKVSRGLLEWMADIVEQYCYGGLSGEVNYFSDPQNFKKYMNRLVLALPKASPQSLQQLIRVLRGLRELQPDFFNEILLTFDAIMVSKVEKAIGENEFGHYNENPNIPHGTDIKTTGDFTCEDMTSGKANAGDISCFALERHLIEGDQIDDLNKEQLPNMELDDSMLGGWQIPVGSSTPAATPSRRSLEQRIFSTPTVPRKLSDSTDINHSNDNIIPTPSKIMTPNINTCASPSSQDTYGKDGGYLEISKGEPRLIQSTNAVSPSPTGTQEKSVLLDVLISRLKNGEVDSHLFRKLVRLSKDTKVAADQLLEGEAVWEGGVKFQVLLETLSEFLCSTQPIKLKEDALAVIRQLLEKQTVYFCERVSIILPALLECTADSSRELRGAADMSLLELSEVVQPTVAIDAVVPHLEACFGNINEEVISPTVPACFNFLTRVIRRLESGQLDKMLSRLVPLCLKGLQRKEVLIRKEAVDTLVAIYHSVGDSLFMHLVDLDARLRGLLNHYFSKNTR
ncbi:uncharacterized protein VTP21DRAFT_6661 [Calcarisporiella thermophila]|uniref:uncharacterized protein n=1 Tax=Calcarisporiella thermophila TaxID=911321 RepID=UPI0037423028